MGDDTDGSPEAALGALDEDESRRAGFFGRLIGALSPTDVGEETPADPTPASDGTATPVPGMVNLRRMRVEDVMLPKAEIVSVSEDISKDDLVEVFRSSGLTRVPVFRGT
ncbi:MAG: magnesium/cobalt efflux protein, partial [Maritimibacter sp.]|nr:magnesium/cobalt efflux protein [Maritimibacter sp.]